MNLLFIGDIVGKGGRKAVKEFISGLNQEYCYSFCIANAENIAGGSGVNEKSLNFLKEYVNVFTLGDHLWDQKSFQTEINRLKSVIRPSNLNIKQPGKGYGIFKNIAGGEIAIINLLGRVFMKETVYCPFVEIDRILQKLPSYIKTIFVDFHAEATSEKIAMGRFLDGKVTAVLGTHTHVQTADAKILPGGTAYISDVGMVGAVESVLGRSISDVIYKFTTNMPTRLKVVETGKFQCNAVIISYDIETGEAKKIIPISKVVDIL